jgi:alpha-tubulin suppressor-like RCC1 family protein
MLLLLLWLSVGFMQAKKIDTGDSHTCAIYNTKAYCWGFNLYGQLGINSTLHQISPVQVHLLNNVISVSCGSQFSCFLQGNLEMYCVGSNGNSQLGDSNTQDRRLPYLVGTSIIQITTGGYHTCSVSNTNVVLCWGMNGFGQIGQGYNGGDPFTIYTCNK